MSVELWGYDHAHCDGHECVKDCDRCPYNVERNIFETAFVSDSQAELGASCVICGGFIPIHFPSQAVSHFCDECISRLKHVLYPTEIFDLTKSYPVRVTDNPELNLVELHHVTYDDAQLGREK